MNGKENSINYDKVPTHDLIVIQALNDWSSGALGEGEAVHLTYSGDDPACVTFDEFTELLNRTQSGRGLLYPTNNFLLSEETKELRFHRKNASYRLTPHIDQSHASAINVAEAKHVSDVEACHQLWLFCATEDCMAYLDYQMSEYGLWLEEEETAATKRTISGFLQNQFSVGHVWNAIWRSVRHAAALSKRQYYNNAKAAKTIPKQIDKVLTDALENRSFQPYDRIAATPAGAVLSTFRTRFGVDDTTPGSRVLELLTADAKNAPEPEEESLEEETRVSGMAYFHKQYTALDRLILSCIDGVKLDTDSPQWDKSSTLGVIYFTTNDFYSLDAIKLSTGLLRLMQIEPPNLSEIEARTQDGRGKANAVRTAFSTLVTEKLKLAGVNPSTADAMGFLCQYPCEPSMIVSLLKHLPVDSGLAGMRLKCADITGNYISQSDILCVGDYDFEFAESLLERNGKSDIDIVNSVCTGDMDALAETIATSLSSAIRNENAQTQSIFLRKVAENILNAATPVEPTEKKESPGTGAS